MQSQVRVIRTTRFWIKPHPMLRHLCHLSKNLFNEVNYLVRQTFFSTGVYVKATELQDHLQDSPNFQVLPRLSAQKILKLVEQAWKSFFATLKDWHRNPRKYFQRPRPPKYKRKDGEFLLWLTKSQLNFNSEYLQIPQLPHIKFNLSRLTIQSILGVRIVPQGIGYVVEILYAKEVPAITTNSPSRVVGIDLGLTNLITMVNNIGTKPIVVKGGVVKSINQFYNKERARLQGIYDKQQILTGKKQLRLTDKRNRKIANYFHEVSRFVIDWCTKNHIDTIVVGKNKYWKQKINMGKRTNQSFVFLPFANLIQMLSYKAQDAGIRCIQTREDYTSKCSFLDQEPIHHHQSYRGIRISRGLFCSSTNRIINSDVNGGYNIIKKEVPNAFASNEATDGIEGVWLHPVRWKANGHPIAG